MSRICELTGVGPLTGNNVSHSNRRTRTRWLPNLKKKKYLIPELGRTVTLTLSTRAIRTIDKLGGITPTLRGVREEGLSEGLLRIKRDLQRKDRPSASKNTASA